MQPNIETDWTQTLTVNFQQSFRVGGFWDNSGWLDTTGAISLEVSGPYGWTSAPVNGSYITVPFDGTYVLRASCVRGSDQATLSNSATITVLPGDPNVCPFQSIEARGQKDGMRDWTQTLTVDTEQGFRVGGFYFFDGTKYYDQSGKVALRVTGPNGFDQTPVNGSYVLPPALGEYTVTGTCGSLTDTARVTVESEIADGPCMPDLPNTVTPGGTRPEGWTEIDLTPLAPADIDQSGRGWYLAEIDVDYFDLTFGKHFALGYWDGASWTYTTAIQVNALVPSTQEDIADSTWTFYRLSPGQAFPANSALDFEGQTQVDIEKLASAYGDVGLPYCVLAGSFFICRGADQNCNTYGAYLLRALGYLGNLPDEHPGTE